MSSLTTELWSCPCGSRKDYGHSSAGQTALRDFYDEHIAELCKYRGQVDRQCNGVSFHINNDLITEGIMTGHSLLLTKEFAQFSQGYKHIDKIFTRLYSPPGTIYLNRYKKGER